MKILFFMVGVMSLMQSSLGLAQEESEGQWSLSGSAGLGNGYFGLRLTVQYFFNDYVGTSVSGSYTQVSDGDDKASSFGPEAAAIFRLANPTTFTPYAGVGLGYELWKRQQNGNVFDDSGSPTTLYFVGLGIGVSSYMSLNIQNTWTTYLGDPPRRFGNHDNYESRTRSEIGLGASISL